MTCLPETHAYGAVASGHKVTTAAAIEILQDGGNAFDAVIAGLWAACVAEPVLCSPAGGGFLMAQSANSAPQLFDFFVAAPLEKQDSTDFGAIQVNFGTAHQEFHIGAGSTATPGFVPGLYAVHQAFGQLPMKRLLAPAIKAARQGIKISGFQAHVAGLVAPILKANPHAKDHFAPGGILSAEGNTAFNPSLGETFDQLAEEGLPLFNHGDIAQAMAATCAGNRGHLTDKDFAAYEVKLRQPLTIAHSGWQLSLNPPPAAGGALIGLTLQKALEIASVEELDPANEPLILAKALAHTASNRHQGPELIAKNLDPRFDVESDEDRIVRQNTQRGTTHISVIDQKGNAASATVSNGEGNGHMVGGFFMNNILGEDDVNPAGLGNWTPGTRLSSMMAPSLLQNGDHLVALGSGGSNRIRSAIAQVISHIANGAGLDEAIAAPRLHVEADHLDFEDQYSGLQRSDLTAHFPDHRAWNEPNMFFGGVHAVARKPDGSFVAIADKRRDGAAMAPQKQK